MYPGYHVYFSGKGPDLGDLSSVRSLPVLKDHLADSLLLVLIYGVGKLCKPLFVICKLLLEPVSDGINIFISLLLIVAEYGLFHLL